MELTVERWNVVFHDGAIAAGAFRRKHVEVIATAIRFAVTFMEAIVAELLATLGTEEVLGVPGFFKRCHAFLLEENLIFKFKILKNSSSFLHPKSAHCNKHNADWKDCGNQLRSKVHRRVQRSSAFPTPDCSDCKWNAPDAKSCLARWWLDRRSACRKHCSSLFALCWLPDVTCLPGDCRA